MPQYFGQLPTAKQPWIEIEAVQAFEVSDRHIEFICGPGRLRLTVLADNLIRLRFAPTGAFRPRRSWAVALEDEAWGHVPFTVESLDDRIEIQTDRLQVRVYRSPCRVEYRDRQGHSFARDAEQGMSWRPGEVAAWKHIEPDEHFYGFGERAGLLDRRGSVHTNWTTDALDYNILSDELYQAIPFLMSLRQGLGYGLFFNTTFWSRFDIGHQKTDLWQMETPSDELDYYLIYGPEPAEILKTYTQLTGRMPMPPRWALGYQQCRWSYESEEIVRHIATEFRDRQIPCDVIYLDIDYMRAYRVFTWSRERFPQPAQLSADLQEAGFKLITIVDPGVKYDPEGNYAIFDDGLEQDYFVRKVDGELAHGYVWPEKVVFPDFLRPEVRRWWGDAHRALTDVGVAGIWNDMNEPSLSDRPFGDNGNKIALPFDAPQGPPDQEGTHAETHNLYGFAMCQACYEGLEQIRPNQRSFLLTRSGYAGIQRWSAVWTGDNNSVWEHLEQSISTLCNLGLSGVSFVGADIGGFARNASPELFARWMQLGLLYPLMRGHTARTTAAHEPWSFGEEVEQVCREAIELRYRLLPYLYTLFWESASTGAPILRPLLYHYSTDPETYTLSDQAMLGPSLLAAPVYRPGQTRRMVYLPEGTWYDWWTGDRHEGPSHILADAPLNRLPLYVKAGAIVPLQPVMQYTDEQPIDPLTLRIYPGTGEWTFYEDDGRTLEYQTGHWATTTYRVWQTDEELRVEIGDRHGTWCPPARQIVVEVVGLGQQTLQDDGQAHQLHFPITQ